MEVCAASTPPPGAPRSATVSQPLLWLVVALWLMGASAAFWFFELRLQRPFVSSARATLFESGAGAAQAEEWFRRSVAPAPSLADPAVATVVHVFEASCPCNRFTDPHLAQIQARYRARNVRFVRVEHSSAMGADSPRWIEATPAALVFDAHGKLVYFGPYSDSASCGTSGGLVERVLDRVLARNPPAPQLLISAGCFCSKQSTKILGIEL